MLQTQTQSVTFTVDTKAHLVRLVGTRDPTLNELGALGSAIVADHAYRPDFDFLADCTAIDEPPSAEYVHRFIDYLARNGDAMPKVRWAQVVQKGAAFGMARMAGIMGAESLCDYRVFSDVHTAEYWLAGMAEPE